MVTPCAGDGIDKLAIAQKVIVSAGDVLAAAGFERDEIAAFFRQAADHLEAASAPTPMVRHAPAVTTADDAVPNKAVADLQALFAKIGPIRALANMAGNRQVIAGLRAGTESAGSHLERALQMLPVLAEAQDWLRDAAADRGLTMVADRGQRLLGPVSDQADAVGNKLFLDDFEAAYEPCLDLVTAVLSAIVRERDEHALNQLLYGLVDCGVVPSHELKNRLVAGVETLVPPNAKAT